MVVETSPDDSCDRDCLHSFNPLLDGMVIETLKDNRVAHKFSSFNPLLDGMVIENQPPRTLANKAFIYQFVLCLKKFLLSHIKTLNQLTH